jgi:hypothetical protein
MQNCYGATTLNTSGLMLTQLEQVLGTLALPGLPQLTLVPGGVQNATQQDSVQSQTGDGQIADPTGDAQAAEPSQTRHSQASQTGGGQAQVAMQANTTVQVAFGLIGNGGPTAVNQTSQGIWQLQIGCLFDCTGTQQLQQATQSNTTVQAVGGTDATTANTVTQIVWQLQIGCLFWCYDAVEAQTATSGDSTGVITPRPAPDPASPPEEAPAPASSPPAQVPAPSSPSSSPSPSPSRSPGGDPAVPADSPSGSVPPPEPTGAQDPTPPITSTRGEMLGASLGFTQPVRIHPVLRGTVVAGGSLPPRAGGSVSPWAGGGEALVSVPAIGVAYSQLVTRAVDHRQRGPRAQRPKHEPARTTARQAHAAAVAQSDVLWPALLVAAGAALALGAGLRRRFRAR